MPSKAKAAKGTQLKRGDGATPTESFTTVGEVLNFSGPEGSAPAIDVTSFDSTATEVIAGLPDNGEVSFDTNFVGGNAQQQGLEADRIAGTLRNFRLQLNDNASSPTTYAFSAIVTKVGLAGGDSNQAYKLSITLRVSGATTKIYAP
jgi:hypothetical protein